MCSTLAKLTTSSCPQTAAVGSGLSLVAGAKGGPQSCMTASISAIYIAASSVESRVSAPLGCLFLLPLVFEEPGEELYKLHRGLTVATEFSTAVWTDALKWSRFNGLAVGSLAAGQALRCTLSGVSDEVTLAEPYSTETPTPIILWRPFGAAPDYLTALRHLPLLLGEEGSCGGGALPTRGRGGSYPRPQHSVRAPLYHS